VGLTSRLLNSASGAQYLAVSIGQAYYFEKPRVVLPGEPQATRDTSDFIAQVSLTAYKNWNLDAGLQWNPEDQQSERSQFRLQYRPDGDHVVNLGYRFQRERIEQVDTSVAWPISNKWNAFGRYVYSLLDSKTLDEFAGFEFKACCYRVRTVAPGNSGCAIARELSTTSPYVGAASSRSMSGSATPARCAAKPTAGRSSP
jgi:LPS-assembly protein